ncbi:MAG: uracil-xanthine permease family protein [Mycoplasmoidaceae bacterium]
MLIGIHQVPKSFLKFILLSFQHVFAMFGANILAPLIINSMIIQQGGTAIISTQMAFFGSGVGTIIYLICTGFKVPIYLGSSFAYMAAMGSMFVSSGYNVFLALMIVALIYIIVAGIIQITKSSAWTKKFLPPVVIGPAIMMIGLGLFPNAANDSGLTGIDELYQPGGWGSGTAHMAITWTYVGIAAFTLITIMVCLLVMKNFLKIIPILIGLILGSILAIIVWGIAKGVGNDLLANSLFKADGNLNELINFNEWKWYPDVTQMWTNEFTFANGAEFKIQTILGIVPLAIITIAEHIGDHMNIGAITNKDFITTKPGLQRTLLGDGLATLVSVSIGAPPNTSYGENTSVIAVSKVASVWVVFSAALIAITLSFIAPLSGLIAAIPKPVIGGIEIILFAMIAINGLKLLIINQVNFNNMKNVLIFAVMMTFGLGGAAIYFWNNDGLEISLAGNGLAVILGVILNIVLADEKEVSKFSIEAVDLSPTQLREMLANISNKGPKKTKEDNSLTASTLAKKEEEFDEEKDHKKRQ